MITYVHVNEDTIIYQIIINTKLSILENIMGMNVGNAFATHVGYCGRDFTLPLWRVGGKIQPHSHNHNSHLKKYQNVRKSGQLWDLRGYFSCIWENAGRCGNYFTLIFPHFPQKTTHIGWDSHKSFLHSHIMWVGRWEDFVGPTWEWGGEKSHVGGKWERNTDAN